MNEKQAIEKGYGYTGAGGRFKEDAIAQIQKLKAKYPKAKFVTIYKKDSGYSRGGSDAWFSVYADKKYVAYKRIESTNTTINNHQTVLDKINKKYKEDLEYALKSFSDASAKNLAALKTLK